MKVKILPVKNEDFLCSGAPHDGVLRCVHDVSKNDESCIKNEESCIKNGSKCSTRTLAAPLSAVLSSRKTLWWSMAGSLLSLLLMLLLVPFGDKVVWVLWVGAVR